MPGILLHRVVAAAGQSQHAALVSAHDAHACFVEAQHHYDTLNSELNAELFSNWALYGGNTVTQQLVKLAGGVDAIRAVGLWRFIVAMEGAGQHC